jgi:MscS family membrane protein
MLRFSRVLPIISLAAALVSPLQAQLLGRGGSRAPANAPAPKVVVDSASPRASVRGYLLAVRADDFARAAQWLDQSAPAAAARAPELAQRLGEVLDTYLWVDLEKVSPAAAGDTTDGLPADQELLGEVPDGNKRLAPIRLQKDATATPPHWVFSAGTVARIDSLYEALPDYWARENLPEALLGRGPLDVRWWQWLALITMIPLAGLVGYLFASPLQAVLRRMVANTDTDMDDKIIAAARGPIALLLAVALSRILLAWVALPGPAEAFVVQLQKAIAVVAAFWIVLRGINVLKDALPDSDWGALHPAMKSLMPLAARVSRLVVFVLGVLTVIATFGYPIATILAGLGIGGIAVALGAQKSLEHFFGSVSIGVDQPFRVGDWVVIDGIEGEVEAIGLRSTRIRTPERTIVSFPNGGLSEARTENMTARERIRFRAIIGVEYGTSAATMQQIRNEIEAMLRDHAMVWPDRVVVRFKEFAASSLDFEVFCWITTPVADEFRRVREEILLSIMRIVEGAGASFAFPTQTVWVKQSEGVGKPG